jgi:hypothetical protein
LSSPAEVFTAKFQQPPPMRFSLSLAFPVLNSAKWASVLLGEKWARGLSGDIGFVLNLERLKGFASSNGLGQGATPPNLVDRRIDQQFENERLSRSHCRSRNRPPAVRSARTVRVPFTGPVRIPPVRRVSESPASPRRRSSVQPVCECRWSACQCGRGPAWSTSYSLRGASALDSFR